MYVSRRKKLKTTHKCTSCKSHVNPVIKKQGTFLIEIIIWILTLFIVPQTAGASVLIAVAYSVFRLLSKKIICPKCASEDIILKDTSS